MILIGPKIVAASKVLLRNPMLKLFESPLRVHLCVYGNHLEWEPPKELQRSQGGEQPGYPTKIFAVTKYWKKYLKILKYCTQMSYPTKIYGATKLSKYSGEPGDPTNVGKSRTKLNAYFKCTYWMYHILLHECMWHLRKFWISPFPLWTTIQYHASVNIPF